MREHHVFSQRFLINIDFVWHANTYTLHKIYVKPGHFHIIFAITSIHVLKIGMTYFLREI